MLRGVPAHHGDTGGEQDGKRPAGRPHGGPDGPWPSAPGAGHGLTVLRERVAALGGTVLAEPVEQGFRVVARIPDGAAG